MKKYRWGLIGGVLVFAAATGFFMQTARLQWDLKVYMTCARTLASGGDPYTSVPVVDGIGYQCLYPPLATDLYRPFAAASDAWPGVGEKIWAGLKGLSLFLMLWLWREYLLPPGADFPRLLFIALAYGSPFWSDFRAGNAASFEHLVLWAGLAAFVAGKDWLFIALVAAAAQPKLLPVAFLGLALTRSRPRPALFLGGLALAAGAFGLNELIHPGLLRSFFHQLADPSQPWRYERGPNNCSTWGFFQHVYEVASGDRARAVSFATSAHFLWSGVIAAATSFSLFRLWRGNGSERAKRLSTVLLFAAAYALAVPRLKDYSFFLLIPPTLAALESGAPAGILWAIAIFAVLNSTKALGAKLGMGRWDILLGYFKLYAVVLVWWVLAFHPRRKKEPA
ncbi:MAG: glycosyltransferase 87 family protein [Elusimicrobiota bacterium]